MSDVADSFKKIISQSQTDSTVQTYSAAEGRIITLHNVEFCCLWHSFVLVLFSFLQKVVFVRRKRTK